MLRQIPIAVWCVPQEHSAQGERQHQQATAEPARGDVRSAGGEQEDLDVDASPRGKRPSWWELPEPMQLRSEAAAEARPDQEQCQRAHLSRARKRLSLVPERHDEEAACRVQDLQEELDSVRQQLAEAVADNQALTEAADAARVAAAQAAADMAGGSEAPPPQRARLVSPRRWGSARARQLAQQLEEAERVLRTQACMRLHGAMPNKCGQA